MGILKSYYKTLVLLIGFSPGLKEGLIGPERDEIKSSMINICMIIRYTIVHMHFDLILNIVCGTCQLLNSDKYMMCLACNKVCVEN